MKNSVKWLLAYMGGAFALASGSCSFAGIGLPPPAEERTAISKPEDGTVRPVQQRTPEPGQLRKPPQGRNTHIIESNPPQARITRITEPKPQEPETRTAEPKPQEPEIRIAEPKPPQGPETRITEPKPKPQEPETRTAEPKPPQEPEIRIAESRPPQSGSWVNQALAADHDSSSSSGQTITAAQLREVMDALPARERRTIDDLKAVAYLAGALLIAGCILMCLIIFGSRRSDDEILSNPLRPYALQVLGLTFILPVVLVISVAIQLNSEAITALLGAIVGYIFGSSRPAFIPMPESERTREATPQPEVTPQSDSPQ